ncbi:hypothetical protein CP532_5277 [Ophiocordyceps camponoti-leonardi (nom. inval.)]|nr:hypothetical protein CP532_5277 [Ophiocordyceps camponoti-leonardi (nom. inval.)]
MTAVNGTSASRPVLFLYPRHSLPASICQPTPANFLEPVTSTIAFIREVSDFDDEGRQLLTMATGTKVHDLMVELIDQYFVKHLDLPSAEATRLHQEYYTNYGLAIEGLVRHHQIDPLEYNAKVDDALPLETVIKPNPELRRLLEDIDKTKVKTWLFTNAYVNHAKRVVRILGIEDLFDGLTYCDYAKQPIICKPRREMYDRAMQEAGVEAVNDCYFIDDSYLNCSKAQEFGWTTVHLVEDDLPLPKTPASQYQIRHLNELRTVFPQFFKPT